jgi:hypothetical protein
VPGDRDLALTPLTVSNSAVEHEDGAIDIVEHANCEHAAAVRRRVRYFTRPDLCSHGPKDEPVPSDP